MRGRVWKLRGTPAAAPGGALAAGMTKQQVMSLYPEGSYELVPNDGMRKTVAARLTEAKQTIPHFYLTLDCRIDALMEAREQINAAAPMKDGKPAYKLSVNDFVIKAWALALQRVPLASQEVHTFRGMLKAIAQGRPLRASLRKKKPTEE